MGIFLPTVAMAKDDLAAPSFKEALKQDRSQYDDCTPCRVVGELPTSPITRP